VDLSLCLHHRKNKSPPVFSGGFVFNWQTAYFGLELPVPVVLVPLLVELALFLWCR